MRPFIFASFASLALSQTFEASDFNVTEALIAQGVDVASLPGLSGLVRRSSKTACDIAVCLKYSFHSAKMLTDISVVRLKVYTETIQLNFKMSPATLRSHPHSGLELLWT